MFIFKLGFCKLPVFKRSASKSFFHRRHFILQSGLKLIPGSCTIHFFLTFFEQQALTLFLSCVTLGVHTITIHWTIKH